MVLYVQFGLTSASLIMFARLNEESTEVSKIHLLFVASTANAITWFYLLYWCRMSQNLNLFIGIMQETIKSIRSVIIVLLIIFCMFGSQIIIFQTFTDMYSDGDQQNLIFEHYFGFNFIDVLVSQYFEVLGFASRLTNIMQMDQTLTNHDFEDKTIVSRIRAYFLVTFVFAIFLSNFIVMNMVIAVTSATFLKMFR